MPCEYLSQAFNGKPVISVSTGQIIGRVVDTYVDPDTLRLAAVITSKGRMLRRELEGFLSSEVELWGQDTVLVRDPDIIQKGDELALSERWLRVSDHIKGHDVVDAEGTRIGRINDVVIDCDGRVVGYNLSAVLAESPMIVGGRIAVEYTHSLGPDILIVDMAHGSRMGETAHAATSPADE